MTKVELYKIIVLFLLAIVATVRWVRYFRAKKRGEEHQFTKFETISVVVLMTAFVILTFFVKGG
ncbi:MAG TPA: hypothetical protein VLZ83_14370 [Edaphocola sp.]|nr:hypothetical protein [Edaphocola sp.]